MSILNTPLKVNKLQIKNRFFKAAMSEQLGDDNHNPTEGLCRVYEQWANGGVGISVSGNIMVDRNHLGEPKNVVLDSISDLGLFKKWTKAATQNNTEFWAQINHPGKQIPIFLSKQPVAPSAIALGEGLDKTFAPPRELKENEIEQIIHKFAITARLAKQVGFTGVQIHGAHGYLISQFLSPKHNQRNDQWGGSLKNRMRFVICIYQQIREYVGDDFPVSIKLNSADFMKGGFTQEESMQVVKKLEEIGIDLIEISGGTYENPQMISKKKSTIKREAYFLDYAEKVKKLVRTPIVVTGGFRSARAMSEAIESGATDMIGLARSMAIYPDLPAKAIENVDYIAKFETASTGIKYIDKMLMIGFVWYEQQIHLMAKGKRPNPKLSAWIAGLKTLYLMGIYAFKKRRA